MQDVERHVGLGFAQGGGDVAIGVDRGNAIAEANKRIGTGFARAQRNIALRRPASHQNGDVLGHAQSNAFSSRFH